MVWNKSTQLEFAALLAQHDGFMGSTSRAETAFSARDRLRGPRLLGFVCTPKRGTQEKLEFTDVGNLFLDADSKQQEIIFQRQVSKVQYRSHLHYNKGFEVMNVRPMALMIKLLLQLERLSKEEIALFALTLTDHRKINATTRQVKTYRNLVAQQAAGTARKEFRQNYQTAHIKSVYHADITAGKVILREGGSDFIKTKMQTLRDYADATIRYLMATGIFTVSPHGQALMLAKTRMDDALFILRECGTGISQATDLAYVDYVKKYLGNPSIPRLRIDQEEYQSDNFKKMIGIVRVQYEDRAIELENTFKAASSGAERTNVLFDLEELAKSIQIQKESKNIKNNLDASLIDIKNMGLRKQTRSKRMFTQ